MSAKNEPDNTEFLSMMSKKGFYQAIVKIDEAESMHYNDILRFLLEKKIVGSRAWVTIILNNLTGMSLVERTVTDTHPIRTKYNVTKKGRNILGLLEQIGKEIA
jgi:DNA-binding HxlR family transcriptional regulator